MGGTVDGLGNHRSGRGMGRRKMRHSREGARLTLITKLLLAPGIQEQILLLGKTERGRDAVTERELWPIAGTMSWGKQRRMWRTTSRRISS